MLSEICARTVRHRQRIIGRGAKYRDQRVCMFVCLSVCLVAYVTKHSPRISVHVRFCITYAKNLQYMLPVAVAGSSSGGSALCYMYFWFCG